MARITCEWGLAGARHLAASCAVIVIIDVLSFSTSVDVAAARGAAIIPCRPDHPDLPGCAAARGAILAGKRGSSARFSLSPASFAQIEPGTRVVLPSPNGSLIAGAVAAPLVMAACLRNAAAVAAAALENGGDIGLVPAGERWPDGTLRPAIEDWLGAGAVIDALGGIVDGEARAAAAAFRELRHELADVLRHSLSGQELISGGYREDVEHAAAFGVSGAAPRLVDGAFHA